MTVTGIVRGNSIEITEPLPYAEGEELSLSIQRVPRGNAAALLEAVLAPPHVDPEAVEEMLRAIEEGKQPVSYRGIFDDLAAE